MKSSSAISHRVCACVWMKLPTIRSEWGGTSLAVWIVFVADWGAVGAGPYERPGKLLADVCCCIPLWEFLILMLILYRLWQSLNLLYRQALKNIFWPDATLTFLPCLYCYLCNDFLKIQITQMCSSTVQQQTVLHTTGSAVRWSWLRSIIFRLDWS